MNKALFLDRDGVINKEKNYLYQINAFEFIADVFDACRYFQNQGYLIIVITNQAGIARGIYTEKDFTMLTQWMVAQFEKEGIKIAQVYHCPHHPDFTGECVCRKPHPGMILTAQKDFNIDLSRSILVGDKNSDIEAGINAGVAHNFLVQTGHAITTNKFNAKIFENLSSLIDQLDKTTDRHL